MQRILILGGVAAAGLLGPPAGASPDTNLDVQSLVLRAGEYRIVNEAAGERIEMAGFGQVMSPGKPMLPARDFPILLPPGARVVSLEVDGIGTRGVPGIHRISPTRKLLPLTRSRELLETAQREWDASYRETYDSDEAYPPRLARITGSGTLRKYSYVTVSLGRKTLDSKRRSRSSSRHSTYLATTCHHLACVRRDLGDEGPRALFERAIGIREARFGPDHLVVAESLDEYAKLLRRMDQGPVAEALETRASTIRERH